MLFVESLIAGGLAGLVVEAALYPIDTIKTRVQVRFSVLYAPFHSCGKSLTMALNVSLLAWRSQCLTSSY